MKKSLEICRREDRTRFWNKLFKLLNSAFEFAENTALFFPPSRYPFFLVWDLRRAFTVSQGLEHCYYAGSQHM